MTAHGSFQIASAKSPHCERIIATAASLECARQGHFRWLFLDWNAGGEILDLGSESVDEAGRVALAVLSSLGYHQG
jgi:hypothetical protein